MCIKGVRTRRRNLGPSRKGENGRVMHTIAPKLLVEKAVARFKGRKHSPTPAHARSAALVMCIKGVRTLRRNLGPSREGKKTRVMPAVPIGADASTNKGNRKEVRHCSHHFQCMQTALIVPPGRMALGCRHRWALAHVSIKHYLGVSHEK